MVLCGAGTSPRCKACWSTPRPLRTGDTTPELMVLVRYLRRGGEGEIGGVRVVCAPQPRGIQAAPPRLTALPATGNAGPCCLKGIPLQHLPTLPSSSYPLKL